MSIWNILEIESTADTSAIKKAYAKKLKQHHPEEDPEGYQQLREAFDAAMKFARSRSSAADQASIPPAYESGVTVENTQTDIPQSDRAEQVAGGAYAREKELQPTPVHPIHEFMDRTAVLYADYEARFNPANWEELLRSDVVWNVELSEELQYALISFLEEHHHLPQEAWAELDTMFQWSGRRNELVTIHDIEAVDVLFNGIQGTSGLGYSQFQGRDFPEDFNLEYYLDLREWAQESLTHGDLETARAELDEAHELFAEDPDLELMRGKCYEQTGEPDLAIACYDACIRMNPELEEARRQRGRLLYDQANSAAALVDFEYILEQNPDDEDALVRAALCLESLGKQKEAAEYFKKASLVRPNYMPAFARWQRSLTLYLRENASENEMSKPKMFLNNLYYCFFVFIRLTWLYWGILLILSLVFDLHPIVYALFALIFLVNGWRIYRTLRFITN